MEKIKQYASALYWWTVLSSVDARKKSLTFKAMIASILPVAVYFGVDASQLPEGIDLAVSVFEDLGVFLTSLVALYGFIRKIRTTLAGTNDVINSVRI